MKTIINRQSPPTNLVLAKAKAKKAVRKIVTVKTGEAQFGVDTKLIRNVVQIADAVLTDDRQAMMMGTEEVPVVPLNDIVNDVMDSSTLEQRSGNTLLIVRSPSSLKSLAVRVDSVSRPVVVENENFYSLPTCIYVDQQNELVESIALIRSDSDEVDLRLIINPLKAFGLDDQQTNIPNSVGRLARDVVGVGNNSKGQMVVFSPAGVGSDIDFQFCLPLPFVAEIIQTDEKSMLPLPMSLPKMSGMVMWRGIPVPVIDLAGQFNLYRGGEGRSNSRLMICHMGQGQHVAFYTQVQIKTLRIPDSTRTDTAWLSGVPKLAAVESEYGLLVVPDLRSILHN